MSYSHHESITYMMVLSILHRRGIVIVYYFLVSQNFMYFLYIYIWVFIYCIHTHTLNFELAWSFFELSALASTVTLALFSPNFTAVLELLMWLDDVALPELGPWTVPTFPRTAVGAGKTGALMLLLTWAAFGIPCFKKLSAVNTLSFSMATCPSRSLSSYRKEHQYYMLWFIS